MDETKSRRSRVKNLLDRNLNRIAKALILTLALGIILLILWVFLSGFLASSPRYLWLFSILIWGLLIFTFLGSLTAETIYQPIFNIGRAFYFIFGISYGTNFGSLQLTMPNGGFVLAQFVPILALIIFICILDVGRCVLQIIQTSSYSPPD